MNYVIVHLVLFAGAGISAYTAYGSQVQTVIILNLPQDQKFVLVVSYLPYSDDSLIMPYLGPIFIFDGNSIVTSIAAFSSG